MNHEALSYAFFSTSCYFLLLVLQFCPQHPQLQAAVFMLREANQLDATEWFIALIICSRCFGHFYAHHQELKTICVLLPPVVCNDLVAGGRRSGVGSRLCVRNEGCSST